MSRLSISLVSESTACAPLGRFDRSGAMTMSGIPAPGIPRLSRSLAGSEAMPARMRS